MSKTLEEIKDEYANEISPHGWFVMTMRQARITDAQVNEVSQRYAQHQTQELQEQKAELVEMLKQTVRALDGNGFPRLRSQIEELLTKYNHLKSKTNEKL